MINQQHGCDIMVREACVILPQGHPDAQTYLEQQLIELFCGFTKMVGDGAWRAEHSGELVRSMVWVYDVAMLNTAANWQDFKRIAQIAGLMAGQDCVYTRSADGEVFYVECCGHMAAAR